MAILIKHTNLQIYFRIVRFQVLSRLLTRTVAVRRELIASLNGIFIVYSMVLSSKMYKARLWRLIPGNTDTRQLFPVAWGSRIIHLR